MTLFCYPNFSTSRMLSTVFDWANDGPSVEREIITILVHLLWLFHSLSFKEVVKLLQEEQRFAAVNLFLGYYEPLRSKAMLYIGPYEPSRFYLGFTSVV